MEYLVRVKERRRHQFRRLAAGMSEHDALVARALVLVAGSVNALRDIGRLLVQEDFDLGVAPMETLLLVADVPYRLARHLLDDRMGEFGAARLAGDDHPVRGRKGLAGHADLVGIDSRLRPLTK